VSLFGVHGGNETAEQNDGGPVNLAIVLKGHQSESDEMESRKGQGAGPFREDRRGARYSE